MAADVYAEPPHVGRGGWTWYTGSAGWMYRAGARMDPRLPAARHHAPDRSVHPPRLAAASRSASAITPRGTRSSSRTRRRCRRGVASVELDGEALAETGSHPARRRRQHPSRSNRSRLSRRSAGAGAPFRRRPPARRSMLGRRRVRSGTGSIRRRSDPRRAGLCLNRLVRRAGGGEGCSASRARRPSTTASAGERRLDAVAREEPPPLVVELHDPLHGRSEALMSTARHRSPPQKRCAAIFQLCATPLAPGHRRFRQRPHVPSRTERDR